MHIYLWIILLSAPVVILLSYIPGMSVAPWVPTLKQDVRRMVEIAAPKRTDIVYDLGCGNGRLLVAAYKKFQCKVVGVDCAPLLAFFTKVHFFLQRVKGKVILNNLFNVPLQDADVVFFFLMPKILDKVQEKLQKELKPGARVVSYAFPFEHWEPTAIDWPKDKMPIYLYVIGEQK